jgi:hypothetical protein
VKGIRAKDILSDELRIVIQPLLPSLKPKPKREDHHFLTGGC